MKPRISITVEELTSVLFHGKVPKTPGCDPEPLAGRFHGNEFEARRMAEIMLEAYNKESS